MFWCLWRKVCLVRDEQEKRILGCSIISLRTKYVYVARGCYRLVGKVTDLKILRIWGVGETFFDWLFLQIVCVLGENK